MQPFMPLFVASLSFFHKLLLVTYRRTTLEYVVLLGHIDVDHVAFFFFFSR